MAVATLWLTHPFALVTGNTLDPTAPEVPPRGPSHNHPLLTSQRRLPVGCPAPEPYQDHLSDDGYQQPQGSVFLSQEYLMGATNLPSYGGQSGNESNKSSTESPFEPPLTGKYLATTTDYSHHSGIMGTISSQKPSIGLTTSSVVPAGGTFETLPGLRNNLPFGSRGSFSSRGLNLEKSWRERCSWKGLSITLIVICLILASLLTFTANYATQGRNKTCLVAEDAAKVIAKGIEPKVLTTSYPTPAHTIPVTPPGEGVYLKKDEKNELTHLQVFNKRYSKSIHPKGYWNIQLEITQPVFMRFNLTVLRSSYLALFGRRNVAPSITQYDFVEFFRSGRTTRTRRTVSQSNLQNYHLVMSDPHVSNSNHHDKTHIHHNPQTLITTTHHHIWNTEGLPNTDSEELKHQLLAHSSQEIGMPSFRSEPLEGAARTVHSVDSGHEISERGLEYIKVERTRRFLSDSMINISVTEYLDTGIWYLAIYNDGLKTSKVSLLLEEAPELQSACLNDCSGRGSCVLGHCECVQGWIGEDCSQSVCPVLCSGHGLYGGGLCHCHDGWKGQECEVPSVDCQVPDCNGHGVCVRGSCRCQRGWKGKFCNLVNCLDPSCGDHGWCVEGKCICNAGWKGTNCSEVDQKVFTCLPDCSGNGHYDLQKSACVCNDFWTGPDCSEARCNLNCIHGICDTNSCKCNEGWTGTRCNEMDCDQRCHLHGQCHNGTCLCIQGWNGRHCTIPGCVNGCSGNGICTTENGEYRCSCSAGWMGKDCSVALETQCNDDKDNDGDSLVDCNDSECCATSECRDHVMCMVSSDPVEVLLRKQPPAVTASFYQKVKFIIEDRNVQSFARKEEFTERRVSVIRGRVITSQGQGIVGVRTSIERESKYGLTATRNGGWFDVLVNGGGAVTLMFQRAHFEPLSITVRILWNQIVVLEPIVMFRKEEVKKNEQEEVSLWWSEPCIVHNHEMMRPRIVPTFLPSAIGGGALASSVFAETQVVQESIRIPGSHIHLVYHSNSAPGYFSTLFIQLTPANISKDLLMVYLKVTVEGEVFEKAFEADPNITHIFTWNKRNVYRQKVYGEINAKVFVGYEYVSCRRIVWETQTARLHGFNMDISNVGGWNLDIHHMYNFEAGLLQKGDGMSVNLKKSPMLIKTLAGNGSQRPLNCRQCDGLSTDARLLTPTALATGPDGSVYMGDFNLIRKVSPDGMISTILQISATQASYGYHLAVSPADGHVYLSDPEKYRVVRLLSTSNVTDLTGNFELFAGNGERCIPGDERHCGDRGMARKARLSHPKGLVISADRTLYLADGTNIRVVNSRGIIYTLIGHHGHKTRWHPQPCSGAIAASQVELQWPTGLSLSTLDNSLHILDDHVVLQVTEDGSVRVRAGTPLHCKSDKDRPPLGTITDLAFAPSGSLFMTEEMPDKTYFVRELTPSGEMKLFAGVTPERCGCYSREGCHCNQGKEHQVLLSTTILLGALSAITVSANGIIHIADQDRLKIVSFVHYLPEDDQNGDFMVAYPKTNELYIFNRHGHHVETRDLITRRTLYAFLYSKNTSFGRLSQVTDSSMNKVVFLRDYKSSVSQIENSAGEKFKVEISRLGFMTRFSERPNRHYDFTYHDDSGLLLSTTSPGRLTTIYDYDYTGRLRSVVTPTGSRLTLNSWMAGTGADSHLDIKVEVPNLRAAANSTSIVPSHILSIINDFNMEFKHGFITSSFESWPNGAWNQKFPWGGESMGSITGPNSLLESFMPMQAEILSVTQRYSITATQDSASSYLTNSYNVLDENHQQRLVERVMLVNTSRILSRKWRGSAMAEEFLDADRHPILRVSYNVNGQPIQMVLGNHLSTLNITYDKFGRLGSREWEEYGEEFDYDNKDFLRSITTRTSAVTQYAFGDNKLLETLTLPSGRSWSYQYDQRGGLQYIGTPYGSSHRFSLQPSFGYYVFSYTSPGASHPYRQHLDHNGNLLLTVFPGVTSKVLYTYNALEQLTEIVSGDGKTTFTYGKDGSLLDVVHEENDLEYKIDYSYDGHLCQEVRIDFGAKTGLSNTKFTYEYDSSFRVIRKGGRVGGQSLVPFSYKYSPTLGVPSKVGAFKYSRPNHNETIIHDGTAIFSRRTNPQFQTTQLSVTIHKMEVFRMDVRYRRDGRIAQTNTYTRNFHSKPYTNTKNFTYDADGQLVAVEAKEPWSFSYDAFGNMLSLTYSTNTIPMKYDAQDRIIKFGEGGYKYDARAAIVQNVREVNYQYDARGRLIRASKAGRFRIRYFYDHEGRLIARKDNFGNVTQFLYADVDNPQQVTHIYNPRDGHLITLVYDDRGHVIFAQAYRNKYYIATDACGTPVMVFNQYGEVVREIMRSPYGHIIYDSNPYVYLPIDYCGGILETRTELVHMPGGRVYDPLIGLWLSPAWEDIPDNLMTPSRLSLYRFNGNDPINIHRHSWQSFHHKDWLRILGYDLDGLAPHLSEGKSQHLRSSKATDAILWTAFTRYPTASTSINESPFTDQIQRLKCLSGFFQTHMEPLWFTSQLETLTPSYLKEELRPENYKFEFARVPGPFGEGILVSTVGGRAIVSATPQANPIFRDVLSSVFNNTFLLDVVLTFHNSYVFFFVKEDFWKASEDMTQLNRLAGEVNITIHEPTVGGSSTVMTDEEKGDKLVDVKIHSSAAIVHIRYGTTPEAERKRLIKHAKKATIRRAWSEERTRVSVGLPGALEWSTSEAEELLTKGSISNYEARFLHNIEDYPELLEDPTVVQFSKDTKRTRRNSKTKKSRRCKKKWRNVFCAEHQ